MNILLDTHVLLWWLTDDQRLNKKARQAIESETHLVYVSSASIWEIAIKKSIGKLKTKENIADHVNLNDFEPLPITLDHTSAVETLAHHHQDPFDRMLIAQAIIENLQIITHDQHFQLYKGLHLLQT